MKTTFTLLSSLSIFCALVTPSFSATNLLKNSGFEDPSENFPGWILKTADGNLPPYVYLLTRDGGGHGQEGCYQGEKGIEIYTSDRVTRLSQNVTVTPGKYRFSAYVRNQMSGDDQGKLLVQLGTQERILPIVSMAYHFYYADFNVSQTGEIPLTMVSTRCGLAMDELSLVRLDEINPEQEPPYLLFDLLPSSAQRSRGIQTYIVGQPQWMDFTVSCLDLKRLDHPSIHFYVPSGVQLSGINEPLLKVYRAAKTTDPSVKATSIVREGVAYEKVSFALPRIEANQLMATVGGAWLNVPSGDKAKILVELEDRGRVFPAREIVLLPVTEPTRQVTPKKILTVAYAVQNWTQSLPHRLDALPRQFKLMGLNVWSDYGLHSSTPSASERTAEEQVRIRAYEQYGVRNFWPNFASFFETDAGAHYKLQTDIQETDSLVVKEDGTLDTHLYNMRYVAQNGKAWRDSVIAAYQRTLKYPRDQKLPYQYSGFINDGMEAVLLSYDPTTLRDFAAKNALDPQTLTVANLKSTLKAKWLAYNLALYNQGMKNWDTALREIDPQLKTVITAGSFGPIGARDPELPIAVQAEWTKHVTYTMPQWYGFMRYYGDHWNNELTRGLREKVYGKMNGRADVIPLFSISMGSGLEDPLNLRFRMFDLLSTSSAVKGIGYYLAANAFADGQFMVGLSEVHTLLADVEDFYVDGVKQDELVRYEAEGPATNSKIHTNTSVRVHTRFNEERIALLTVISHTNADKGEKGTIYLSDDFLKRVGTHADLVIVDHLAKTVRPFSSTIEVDTAATSCMALLEVMRKGRGK